MGQRDGCGDKTVLRLLVGFILGAVVGAVAAFCGTLWALFGVGTSEGSEYFWE